MQISFIDDGIDAIVIDNFYSEEQLQEIWDEIKFLTNPKIMFEDKDELEAAVDVNGNFITNKAGVWVDKVYNNWRSSNLLRNIINNLNDAQLKTEVLNHNTLHKILWYCDKRGHLLSYYENTGYYSKHTDGGVYTVLSYFHKEPKMFSGGDIILHSYDNSKKATIETKNNRVVIIPSCVVHEVSEVKITTKKFSGDGRYCLSAFLNISDRDLKNDFS